MKRGDPVLWKTVVVPDELCTTIAAIDLDGGAVAERSQAAARRRNPSAPRLEQQRPESSAHRYAGDIRVGDLTGSGSLDFVVYRSVDIAHDEGGMKPCFLAAFTAGGEVLWTVGARGIQPSRPGPVTVHDIDGDGRSEVICFLLDTDCEALPESMGNVDVAILDGATGRIKRRSSPAAIRSASGVGPNWAHQRILVADFRGTGARRDMVVKLGSRYVALDESLDVLWTYETEWSEYGDCPAYIPAVGDIDGDGRDELNGGYFLIDDDGRPMWERKLGRNMDSVTIDAWDDGARYAFCSGYGHVVDADGRIAVALGEHVVPHGQELRVARFLDSSQEKQMVIRYDGHRPEILLADANGSVIDRLTVNESNNNTGMEPVYWDGPDQRALLYNGGVLWDLESHSSIALPELPVPEPYGRMAWYHCIPANVIGDTREELILYDPWSPEIRIYSPFPVNEAAFDRYDPGPRQYNARLMD